MNNKKASGFQIVQLTIYSIITIFLIGLGIGALVYAAAANGISGKVLSDLQHENYVRQLTNNPLCLAYEQTIAQTPRVDQRIIAEDKLDVQTISDCVLVSHNPQHARPTRLDIIEKGDKTTEKILPTTTWIMPTTDTVKKSADVLLKKTGVKQPVNAHLSFQFDRPVYTAAAKVNP